MPTPYVNSPQKLDPAIIRRGRYISVAFAPKKFITKDSPVTDYKAIGTLCTYVEVAEVPTELVNETQVYAGGKEPITINEGTRIPDFTITLHGDAVKEVAALHGLSWNDLPAIEYGKVLTDVGALFLYSHDEKGNLQGTTVVTNLSAKILTAEGSAEGIVNTTVTFFSNSAVVMKCGPAHVFAPLAWYDDGGGITNAAAPDGVITTYNLNSSNQSGLSGVIAARKIRQGSDSSLPNYTATALLQYFVQIQMLRPSDTSWVDMTANDASFNSGTGVITTTSVLPDATRLFCIVCLPIANAPYMVSTASSYLYKTWGQWQ